MKTFYFFSFCAIVCICLGNAVGAGFVQDRDLTGSPLSTGDCTVCHGGGNFSPDPVIELLDNGSPVTEYMPGQTYTMKLTINSMNFPAGFGFQLVSLDSANQTGGSFGAAGAGTRTIDINGRDYFEHTTRLTENELEIDWTAPEAGSGAIDVYAVANAVNGNGGTTGDAVATTNVRLNEAAASSTRDLDRSDEVSIFPNPVQSRLQVDLNEVAESFSYIEIRDMQGRQLLQTSDRKIEVGHLNPGMYLAIVQFEDARAVKRFMKM